LIVDGSPWPVLGLRWLGAFLCGFDRRAGGGVEYGRQDQYAVIVVVFHLWMLDVLS